MSGYTLVIVLLLLTSDVRGVQGVTYYLRKLLFSGSRLCQGMLLSFLLSGFLQGNIAADFFSKHDVTQWIFMLDRKVFRSILDHFKKETNQVDPVLGGCCRRHGPYRVGPSSATTLKRVL